MAYEQRELSGSLFKNTKKDSDRAPDYRGDCLINGVSLWVSGWIKETRNGDKFLSIAFTPKVPRHDDFETMKPEPGRRPKPTFDDLEDDIPF